MAITNKAKNNLVRVAPSINLTIRADRYNTEDISQAEAEYIRKNTPAPRARRTDLKQGDLAVVLEGAFTQKKVVFVKAAENNYAIVSGVESVNGVSMFKIDERYLFKLSSSISLNIADNINSESIPVSKAGDYTPVATVNSSDAAILSAIEKVKFMKSYIAEPFAVNHNVEFYSQEY
jgi:large subunit ribosomal protein L6e